ncbi:uncharacterized protein LOC131244218 [Magnolia sinica]|uniref:uncharacterized protein LOC131244218 n=1 Tax=Magnolia sinica TaxID=86752 RepID=UPI002659E96F|nr:uncharacterized protein LOC131244218 [Magnolia sinica]
MLTFKVGVQNFPHSFLRSIVYVKCSRILRRVLWDELATLSISASGPWIVCEDFNAIVDCLERKGSRQFDAANSMEFSEAINDAGLIDASFSGNRFTWRNNQAGTARVWARLDKAFCNSNWVSQLPCFGVAHLPRTSSDHAPLLLSFPQPPPSMVKPFRFQRMWSLHDSFLPLIKAAWEGEQSPHPMINMLVKLRQVKESLKVWNREVFENVLKNVRLVEQSLELIERHSQSNQVEVPSDELL